MSSSEMPVLEALPLVVTRVAGTAWALDDIDAVERWYGDLAFRGAIEHASPALAAQVRRESAAAGLSPRTRRALLGYRRRSAGRPTPFGGLAGAVLADLSSESGAVDRLRLGDPRMMPRGTSAAAGYELTFDVTGQLPATVGEHAVIALQALRELSPAWDVPPALSQWARDFTARFGPTTEVALPAVLDELCPPGDLKACPPQLPKRSAWLADLVLDSDGAPMLELDDQQQRELTALSGRADPRPWAPAQQVVLRSGSVAGLLRSEVAYLGPGGSLADRFGHLFTELDFRRLCAQRSAADGRFAPLRVLEVEPIPRRQTVRDVMAVRGLRRHRIGAQVITDISRGLWGPDRLVVGLVDGLPVLCDAQTGQEVFVTQAGMLADSVLDPLSRLVLGVGRSRYRWGRLFDWGSVAVLRHLPALRVQGVDIVPERWLLRGVDRSEDPRGLIRSLRRAGAPEVVTAAVPGGDRRLPLWLSGSHDAELLHRMLRHSPTGEVEIRRGPGALGEFLVSGSAGGHEAEFVVEVTGPRPPRAIANSRMRSRRTTPGRSAVTQVDVTFPVPLGHAQLAVVLDQLREGRAGCLGWTVEPVERRHLTAWGGPGDVAALAPMDAKVSAVQLQVAEASLTTACCDSARDAVARSAAGGGTEPLVMSLAQIVELWMRAAGRDVVRAGVSRTVGGGRIYRQVSAAVRRLVDDNTLVPLPCGPVHDLGDDVYLALLQDQCARLLVPATETADWVDAAVRTAWSLRAGARTDLEGMARS